MERPTPSPCRSCAGTQLFWLPRVGSSEWSIAGRFDSSRTCPELDLLICAACGKTEVFAHDPEGLRRDWRDVVEPVTATTDHPYR